MLEKNDIEMYSMHSKGKSVVTEIFVRTLKNKICKYMNSISKNLYVDELDDIVHKYNKIIQHIIEQLKWDLLI